MLNLCWFKHKKIFECFRCFWKVFCFYKNWKFSKTVLPCFGDSVAGHSSRMLQPRARGSFLVTCSRVEGLVARGTQRFSRLSLRLPCEWDFQSRKTLSKFFQIFRLEVLWRVTLATCFSRKKRVFCVSKTVFRTFSVFPSNFCDCSLCSPFLSQLKLTQTLLKLHFCIISSQDLQEKGMGFLCLTWFFMFQVLFFLFLSCHCVLRYTVFEIFLFRLMGLCWLFLLLISFANHNLSLYANLYSELFRLLGFILIRFMGLELSMIYTICEFGCLNFSTALVWLTDSKWLSLFCWDILIWFCVLLSWVYWVISYSSWYVTLTYVCPLGDVLFGFIRTILQNVVCSWVSTNGYTHLSYWFMIVNVALSLSLYDTNRVLIFEYTYTVLCCCGLF